MLSPLSQSWSDFPASCVCALANVFCALSIADMLCSSNMFDTRNKCSIQETKLTDTAAKRISQIFLHKQQCLFDDQHFFTFEFLECVRHPSTCLFMFFSSGGDQGSAVSKSRRQVMRAALRSRGLRGTRRDSRSWREGNGQEHAYRDRRNARRCRSTKRARPRYAGGRI